jgi:hypothetical protein
MTQKDIDKLFELLSSRVLASHRGGPGSIPSQTWHLLLEMEITLVKSLHRTMQLLRNYAWLPKYISRIRTSAQQMFANMRTKILKAVDFLLFSTLTQLNSPYLYEH